MSDKQWIVRHSHSATLERDLNTLWEQGYFITTTMYIDGGNFLIVATRANPKK